jgi:hydroxyacylglutathione hydrolase
VSEGDTITLESCQLTFRVLDTPGHTAGHVCYVGHNALFCGDTLFAGGCGRLFEGTAEQMYASLEKLRALPDETLVYCAHEYTQANLAFAVVAEPENPVILSRLEAVRRLRAEKQDTVPSPLGLEKKTNPFLRSHVPSLVRAAEAFAGHALSGPAEVFATVRYWKDTLD